MPQKNSGNRGAKKESGISAKNRRVKSEILNDLRKGDDSREIHIARVLRRFGNGRVEVFYVKPVGTSGDTRGRVGQAVICGSFRGRGKRSVWIDVNSFVAVAESGLGGSVELEIVAVFSPEEMRDVAKEFNLDPRVTAIENIDSSQLLASKMGDNMNSGYEFNDDALDVDDI